MKVRTPPAFSRTPSRRYQRRVVEGAVECEYFSNKVQQKRQNDRFPAPPADEPTKTEHYQSHEIKHVSIPQPAQL